jgi:hypothetical protein
MKIFLSVREEYEQALMRDEEVVAGIPAYVHVSSVRFPSVYNPLPLPLYLLLVYTPPFLNEFLNLFNLREMS